MSQESKPTGDIRQEITDRIIEALERGVAPWQKPWSASSLLAMNPTTGNTHYRGVNRLLLSLGNHQDNRWMTYAQAAKQGWQVRKGEKGMPIIKVVEIEPDEAKDAGRPESEGDEKQDRRFALRRYTVFNAEQIDGIPALPESGTNAFDPIEKAENVLDALKVKTGLTILHGGADAFYHPKMDLIRLPPKKAFKTAEDYYSVALHEGAHSTGHESRIGRDLSSRFGTEGYAAEELIAEISSAILSAQTGIPLSHEHIEQHSSYVGSWLKALREDKMAIFRAAKDAEKVCDYLLGLEREYSQEKETTRDSMPSPEAAPSASLSHLPKREAVAALSL
jgi:antirestriction protein ArdC